MLRAFTLGTRKLLFSRPPPVYTLTSEAASSISTANYNLLRSSQDAKDYRIILPLSSGHNEQGMMGKKALVPHNVRWASTNKGFQIPNPSLIVCNMIDMLKCVDLNDMKDSPSPKFWVALIVGGAQVVIPLLEILGGYSNILTIFQLHLAAFTVADAGGIKWGLAVSKNPIPPPTWDTMMWIATPTLIALIGLLLPYPLGFLTVGAALLSSLYLDLKSCAFPPWGVAVRLFLTLTSLVGLLMALTAYLTYHNRENKEKKEKKMKTKAALVDEEDKDEEESGPKSRKNDKTEGNGK